MRTIALAVVFTVAAAVAAPRLAAAAGCTDCDGPPGQTDGASAGPNRSFFLQWGMIVNGGFTAADVFFQIKDRRRNPKVTGLQFVLSIPVAIYGASFINADPEDYAAWGVTLWSVGLAVHGVLPVIDHFRGRGPSDSTTFQLAPAQLIGWHDGKPRLGLSVAGTF